jgi:hypothetical protein
MHKFVLCTTLAFGARCIIRHGPNKWLASATTERFHNEQKKEKKL